MYERKYRYCMATAVDRGITDHPETVIRRYVPDAYSLVEVPDADCWIFWSVSPPPFRAAWLFADITPPEPFMGPRIRIDRGW